MSKQYFDKLTNLLTDIDLEDKLPLPIEIKHFFSGAALYSNKVICASWSPVGLAFKLSEDEVNELITSGTATPLKYFARGHIKKGYALFEQPEKKDPSFWKPYFIKAVKLVQRS